MDVSKQFIICLNRKPASIMYGMSVSVCVCVLCMYVHSYKYDV